MVWFCFFLFAGMVEDSSVSSVALPPKAKVEVVEESVHGHRVSDSYRWLEDADSPATQKFDRAELAYTRGILDALPGRDRIHQELTALLSIGNIGTPQVGGKYYFYMRRDGSQNQASLLVRDGIHGKDRVLLDVNAMSADGTVALDWWSPSDDGKYVAYGTSTGGSEESTLRIVETASGKLLRDSIDRARHANPAWKKDNSGFYYGRTPKKGDVPAGEEVYHVKIFYHALGSEAEKDPLIFGGLEETADSSTKFRPPPSGGRNFARNDKGVDDPKILQTSAQAGAGQSGTGRTSARRTSAQDIPVAQLADDEDRWLLITVFVGYTKTEMFLKDLKAGTAPVEITSGKDFSYSGEILRGQLYIFTNEDAPRFRVFRVDVQKPSRQFWQEIIPESDAVLKNVVIIHDNLFALYEKNVTSLLKAFSKDGHFLSDVRLPGLGSITAIGGKWDSDEAFFGFQSFTVPPSIYSMNLKEIEFTKDKAPEVWARVDAPAIDPSAYEVRQVWFSSKDGTKVPMFIFHKKGLALNGKNPTVLTGYGGFNISLTPSFAADRYVWLERGGVFAVANLRGGSEFGEDWHRAGMLEKKQNVFDDFVAAAEYLIAQKYTDKDHLAIRGGSNGGLLVGAAFTQRPDLFRAVVCAVPLLDMLRYQHFQIAKLWIPEYGSADDPKQFDWIYAYSPYHHVKARTEYPAILFMTAESDTRVDPMHAKKMAALMQAEAANGHSRERPILLRIETKAGHGVGKPITKQIEELTDVYSFLFWQLGVEAVSSR
jgi:prolyl oligopeptidase